MPCEAKHEIAEGSGSDNVLPHVGAGCHAAKAKRARGTPGHSGCCRRGHGNAQSVLGGCYVNGRGVAKDYVEGYKWWLLAAGQGVEIAKENTTKLENIMSREQIAEGQVQVEGHGMSAPPA